MLRDMFSRTNEVRTLRAQARMTQAELAHASGIAQPNISAYEAGRRTPSAESLDRIRRATRRRPSVVLVERRDRIGGSAAARQVRRLSIIGSVARGTDTPESTLDVLVDFHPRASLLDQAGLLDDLNAIMGLPVNVVTVGSLRDDELAELQAEMVPL